NFSKWFNLGQKPHESRISKIFSTDGIYSYLFSITFYFSLLGLYIFIKEKEYFIKRLSGILIILSTVPTIVEFTSGHSVQTRFAGLPLILFILFLIIEYKNSKLFNVKILNNLTLKNFAVILILLFLISNFSFIRFTRGANHTPPSLQLGNFLGLTGNIYKIERGCLKGAVFDKWEFPALKKMRDIIEENTLSFINLDNYQSFYCDYNLTPPKNIPLWFHPGIIIFKDEKLDSYQNLIDYLKVNKPKVVFFNFDPKIIGIYVFDFSLEEQFYDEIINMGYFNKENITLHKENYNYVIKVMVLKD
ncbi:MAG: hypothetical protein ACQXXF_07395, partial [Thermoplasmatota archaeon]